MNNIGFKTRRPQARRTNLRPLLVHLMSPAERREAQAIAYKAALAVLG